MTRNFIITGTLLTLVLLLKLSAQSEKQLLLEFSKIEEAELAWPSHIELHQGNLLRFGDVVSVNKTQIESINLVNSEILMTFSSNRTLVITAKTYLVTPKNLYSVLIEILDKDQREVKEISEEESESIVTKIDEYHRLADADKDSATLQRIKSIHGRTMPWTILSRYCKLDWR